MLAAIAVLLALAAFYAVLLGVAAAGFVLPARPKFRAPSSEFRVPNPELGTPKVSVIVPARNEASNIRSCLTSILANDYPKDRFEVVVVDDASTDRTREIVREMAGTANIRLVALEEPPNRSRAHKKRALTEGVDAAGGEIILTTDADCEVAGEWISAMVSHFSTKTGMVVGPVLYRRTGSIFADLQALEYVGLVALGAGYVRLGLPHLCNSANLAYRRSAFEAIGGYRGLESITTGDDVFLLHRMGYESEWDVRACMERRAAVFTDPNPTVSSFFAQRKRWTSGHIRYEKLRHRATSMLCYLFYAILAAAFFIPPMQPAALTALCIKVAAEAVLLIPGTRRFGRTSLLLYLLPVQIIQIPYILIIGIAGTFGGYTWKGRDLAR